MNSNRDKYLATCLWLIAGFVIAPDLRSETPTDLLNQIENYNSATCQIIFDETYTCSGVLINNTRDQGRPLILTAAHCLESEEDLESVVVVFGKRKLLKDQAYDGLNWSSSGVSLLSMSKELDFALLELQSEIPVHVAPIYLGWSWEISQPTLISSIHSPDFGDAHYSFSLEKPSLATFDGLYHAVDSGHWRVDHWAGETTSLGSSGAPLLDSNFNIIGGMSGSTDWNDFTSDYFFRFDLAYDHFSDAVSQLKAWVDPDSLGRLGHYQPTYKVRNYSFTSNASESVSLNNGITITEDFSASDDAVINGAYVSVGKMSGDSGSTISVALSQDGSELFTAKIKASDLSQYSENYIPFVTPPSPSGNVSISLSFESTDPSAYITVPKTVTNNLTSYFFALNSNKP